MRVKRIGAALACCAASMVTWAGCATLSPFGATAVSENPVVAPSADFETAWRAAVTVVDEYFDIAREDRLARKITTQPKIGATLLEPWYEDSVGFHERLESSLQTIRRFAVLTVNPAPGGGHTIKVEVFKELEDLAQPDRQTAGRAVFNNEFPVNRTREVVGPVPVPFQWIPRGRDPKLEQAILGRIREVLFL